MHATLNLDRIDRPNIRFTNCKHLTLQLLNVVNLSLFLAKTDQIGQVSCDFCNFLLIVFKL